MNKMSGVEVKRNLNIDYLKIILAICVVAIHTSPFDLFFEPIGYLAENGLLRVAVPLFFIMNGFYFSKVIEGEKKFPLGRGIYFVCISCGC